MYVCYVYTVVLQYYMGNWKRVTLRSSLPNQEPRSRCVMYWVLIAARSMHDVLCTIYNLLCTVLSSRPSEIQVAERMQPTHSLSLNLRKFPLPAVSVMVK